VSVVLDTNILLRLVDRRAPEHGSVRSAVDSLIRNGEELCVVPQVLVEFYVAATRPVEVNGFGWDTPFTLVAIGDDEELARGRGLDAAGGEVGSPDSAFRRASRF